MTDYKDGSPDQDEIDAPLSGAYDADKMKNRKDKKSESEKPATMEGRDRTGSETLELNPYTKNRLSFSFNNKLYDYRSETGRKSSRRGNIARFYNEILDTDERRLIAGPAYGESSTRRGMNKIISGLRKMIQQLEREKARRDSGRWSEMDGYSFPIKLKVDDGTSGIDGIRKGDYKPPALKEFTGEKGLLVAGDTDIASVKITRDRKNTLYAEITGTAMDGMYGPDFSLTDALLATPFSLSIEIARKHISFDRAAGIGDGSIIEFEKYAGEPADIIIDENDVIIAKGEVVVVDENFGVRITDILELDIKGIVSGNIKGNCSCCHGDNVPVRFVLGTRQVTLAMLLGLGEGSVIELDKVAGKPATLAVGGSVNLNAEIIIIDECFGARVVCGKRGVYPGLAADGKEEPVAGEKRNDINVRATLEELRQKASSLTGENRETALSCLNRILAGNPADAACLIIALGSDISSGLVASLPSESAVVLLNAVTSIESIGEEQARMAIEAFIKGCGELAGEIRGGTAFARELMEKSWEEAKAWEVTASLSVPREYRPFGFLRGVDPHHILHFLQGEHPQVIALVLSYLDPALSALILSVLPDDIMAEVSRLTACMKAVQSSVIKDIETVLERKLASLEGGEYSCSGGIDAVVEMLNHVNRGTERIVMGSMEESDPELAEEIKKRMFTFGDVVLLDDRSIQKVLREVDTQILAKALKGADPEVKEKIFRNMSKRAGTLLGEDMDFMGPVLLADVEYSQQKIINVIRELESSGDIIVARAGEDELVV